MTSAADSYEVIMAQRADITRASLGIDYGRYATGALGFDYERLLADTGYDVDTVRAVRIKGLGTNLACFGAVAPSVHNMTRLVELGREIERTFGLGLNWISGSNSSGLELIASGGMPERVNHARIGEGILLGRETVHRGPWRGTFQDVFVLHAEVVEVRRKPSIPVGERCQDAFGGVPAFEDRGEILRALLNVGREDVDFAAIVPLDPGILILGGSSGYLVADVTGATRPVRVGDTLAFSPGYGALLAAMTSPYVQKCPVGAAGRPAPAAARRAGP